MAQQGRGNIRNLNVVLLNDREAGPADNEHYYARWVSSDKYFDKLFLSNVNSAPMSGDFDHGLVPTMAFSAWYGHYLTIHPNTSVDRTKARVGSWTDPQIAGHRIADQNTARDMLVRAVANLLKPEVLPIVSAATAVTWVAPEIGGGANGDVEMWDGMITGEGVHAIAENAIVILIHIAEKAARFFSFGGMGMLVHVYVATLKRGNVTEAFTSKIAEGLNTDLDISNFVLDPAACKIFYDNFSSGVDDTTIGIITERWLRQLPIQALRLRLTVQQASGSGITALSVTGRAIRIFTDFNWRRVRNLYQDEWQNFVAAVEAVGHNKYYGFKKDLGIVRSTNYNNLAYVAKELLVKVNGEASLRNYI